MVFGRYQDSVDDVRSPRFLFLRIGVQNNHRIGKLTANKKTQNMRVEIKKWKEHVDKKYLANIEKIEKAILHSSPQKGEGQPLYVCIELPRGYHDGHKLSIKNLFNIRIRSWNRPNFPLDLIRDILKQNRKDDYMREWVDTIRNNILIYTNKIGENPIKWKDLLAIELVSYKRLGNKEIYAIKTTGERLKVYTPCADGIFREMIVSDLKEITIDHLIPLDFVVNQLKAKYTSLKTIVDEYEKYREKTINSVAFLKIDIEELEKAMTEIGETNIYRLMTKKENSKKGNNTNYKRYVKTDKGDYIFIMAEGLHLESDNIHDYYIYYTSNDSEPKLVKGDAPTY